MASRAAVHGGAPHDLTRWVRPMPSADTALGFEGTRTGRAGSVAISGLPLTKRARCGVSGRMHGVSLSDHADKVTWAGYWEERERKLRSQPVDVGLYAAVAQRLSAPAALGTDGSLELDGTRCPSVGGSSSSSSIQPVSRFPQVPPALSLPAAMDSERPPEIFRRCCIYFDGRVDGGEGLSCYALGKLVRLHGGELATRLTKHAVTHVVCTQLSASKERKALRHAASRGSSAQYFVLPDWITQSVAAGRRLREGRFSLLAQIARRAGIGLASATSASSSPSEAVTATDGCLSWRHCRVAGRASVDAGLPVAGTADASRSSAAGVHTISEADGVATGASPVMVFDASPLHAQASGDSVGVASGYLDASSGAIPATALDDASTTAADSDDGAPPTELDSEDDSVGTDVVAVSTYVACSWGEHTSPGV